MKITYIVGAFPKLSETFVLSQITDLIDHGHEVEIISATRSDEQVVHQDIHKYSLMQKTHYLVKNQSSIGFELNEKLISALFFTDLIHAHFAALPADFAFKISKLFSIPYIFTAHAYDIFINPDFSLLREKFDSAAKVITISDYNREYLLDMLGSDLGGKIQVIRCGVRLENFTYIERHPNECVRILLVGRFIEKKGMRYAIEAFSKVIKAHQNVELRIIGDGELKNDIVGIIDNLHLQGKVSLLGPKAQSEVIKEMEEADIFLLPSVTASNGDKEGVPVTIMEAAATGLPVVSTIHSGIPEVVIDGETGFLVPEKDIDSIAQKLTELINNSELRNRMGKQGRLNIEKLYNHKVEMKKIESLFKRLLKGKPTITGLPKSHRWLLQERLKDFSTNLIENRGDQLRRLEESIKRIGDISRKESEIAVMKKSLSDKDNEIANMKKSLSDKDNEIANMKKSLSDKDNEIVNMKKSLSDKQIEISSLKIYCTKKENEVASMKRICNEKEKETSGLKMSYSEKENEITELIRYIQEKDNISLKLSSEAQVICEWLKEKDLLLYQKEEQLSSVLNSKSWKIIKAILKIKNMVLK